MADDFVQTTPKKNAKAASKLIARKKRDKGVQWVTMTIYRSLAVILI